jgi:hypothetical protein
MRRYAALTAILLVVGALAFWRASENSAATDRANTDARTPTSGTAGQADSQGNPANTKGTAPQHKEEAQYYLTTRGEPGFRRGPQIPLPKLPSPDDVKLHPSELDGRTPQEAVWLDQHGYPTQEELDALNDTSALELAERAAQGDLAAMALLGKKQLADSETLAVGYENLSEAALQGSIWAILAMANHQREYGNYDDAFALYNLAALRGDWVSPSVYMTSMPTQLPQRSFVTVPRHTASLFAAMQYLRSQRGMSPLVNTLRPNIFNRPGTLDQPVGVYRRDRR